MRTVRQEIKDSIGVAVFAIVIFFVFFLIIAAFLGITMEQAEDRRRAVERREKEAAEERKKQQAAEQEAQRQKLDAQRDAEKRWKDSLADAKRRKPDFEQVLAPGERSRCIQKAGGLEAVWEMEKNASLEYYRPSDSETLMHALWTAQIDDFGQMWIRNDSNEPNRARMWFFSKGPNTGIDLLGNSARMEMKRAPDIVQTLGRRDMTEPIKLTGRSKSQYVLDVDGMARVYCISGSDNQTTMGRCCGYPCDMSRFNTCHHLRVLNDEEEKTVTLRIWFYNAYGEGRREGLPGIDY